MTESIFNPEAVSHKGLNYFPISMRTFFRLKALALPLFKALGVIFAPNKNDVGSRQLQHDEGATVVVEMSALNPALAKQRHEEQQEAIRSLADALFNEDSGYVVVMVIMDSLRESFPEFKNTKKEAMEQLNNRDFTADFALEALQGVALANKGLLDPLGLGGFLKNRKLAEVLSSLTQSEPSGNEGAAEESPSILEPKIDPVEVTL